ncbi:MAG: hypothetical protein D6796_16575 [Caldilineae bacterium]|nr:MAG: hypothetical protein D6796_16575 [Caldilineae bacterium]
MQVPSLLKPSSVALPPLYQWPTPVKRTILAVTIALCAAFYILLAVGVVSVLVLAIGALAG